MLSRVIKFHGHYLEILFVGLIACLLIDEHMFSQIRSMYYFIGIDDPLFVATNVDRSVCMHMALGALQR